MGQEVAQCTKNTYPSKSVRRGAASHHAHFGEVEQAVVSEVGSALLDEAQLGQVHAQVGDTGRVAAVQRVPKVPEVSLERDQLLESAHSLLRLPDSNAELQSGRQRISYAFC